jgi:hypothetical protein
VIPFICDKRSRLLARLFTALEVDCPCCTFYRGVALGVIVGSLVVFLLMK